MYIWHLLVCQNYKSESGCAYGDKCRFRHVEAGEKPGKKSKKGGAKGSVAITNESVQFGCVSQDSYLRNVLPRECGKLGSKHAVKFSKGSLVPNLNSVKKRSIAPRECSPCAPKFEDRSHEETLHEEGCARKAAWDLANIYTSSRIRTTLRFMF